MTFTLAELLGTATMPSARDPAPVAVCARTGKQRHETRADADAHLRSLRQDDPHPERLDKYRCWSCGDFHVGHKLE